MHFLLSFVAHCLLSVVQCETYRGENKMKQSETKTEKKNWRDEPVGTCDCCGEVLTFNNQGFSLGAQWLCGRCFGEQCK
jgi:cell division protein FtsI/penicillin-binding protein 2